MTHNASCTAFGTRLLAQSPTKISPQGRLRLRNGHVCRRREFSLSRSLGTMDGMDDTRGGRGTGVKDTGR